LCVLVIVVVASNPTEGDVSRSKIEERAQMRGEMNSRLIGMEIIRGMPVCWKEYWIVGIGTGGGFFGSSRPQIFFEVRSSMISINYVCECGDQQNKLVAFCYTILFR